ncbi:GAF domain-containing sensor histidine kinase [Phormidesmis priestleyi]
MPTSSEFVALCRSQVSLLGQTFGASLSVVYLTEELVEGAETTLMAIAAYPESSSSLEKSGHLALPSADLPQLPAKTASTELPDTVTQETLSPANSLAEQRQFVLPLVHEGMVLGLLVTERDDRSWTNWERSQIEKIADTLALACVMDQRAQWLDHTHRQQRLSQTQQHDVLDNLLHQFRNPLTALRTFGKLLLRRLQPEDANREVATSIVRESDRLQELLLQFDQAIDLGEVDLISPDEPDFSDPSKSAIPLLPAGVLTASNLTLELCAIAEILQPLLVSARAIAQDKTLTIRTAIPELPLVIANSGALREVLSNLIDNALKYTPAGEQIHIRVDADDRVAIRVSDTGCGIPSQDLPRLFERHYRGVQAETDIPGTGLGLAIARRLIEQMQGEIEVFSPMQADGWVSQSDQPPANKGTTFVVWLRKGEV